MGILKHEPQNVIRSSGLKDVPSELRFYVARLLYLEQILGVKII